MTCIVALSDGTKTVVGCDTLAGQGDHSIELETKLATGEGTIIGACGSARILTEIQTNFKFPERQGRGHDEYVYHKLIPAIKRFLEERVLIIQDVRTRHVEMPGNSAVSRAFKKIFKRDILKRKEVEVIRPSNLFGNSQILIASGPKFYVIQSDLTVTERQGGFTAIGCGREYALGSLLTSKQAKDLKPETRVRWALECAANYSQGCAAPFKYLSTGDK